MMRFGEFSLAIILATLPICTGAALAQGGPIVLATLHEESIPAQDLAAPSPAAATSPGAATAPADDTNEDTNSDSGEWTAVPPGKAAPADRQVPVSVPLAPNAQPAPVNPADIAPALDAGSIATTPQVSDSSLASLIASAPTPARAASLRITEQQRVELERGHTDDAIRELAHAISIDPSNSYAYFYLGRAYIARRSYAQAETFFKRAEIGVASNSAWLGETYAFEGVCLEQAGKSADAAAAYQKALAASPGNLTARVGVTRLSAFVPASTTAAAPAPAGDLDQPAPREPEIPTAPDEAPIPPAPHSAPPPPAY
jgi:predicted negative regulator of RcsB-dependent stress response